MKAAKNECSRVESLAGFWKSLFILTAAKKTCLLPAGEADAAKDGHPLRAELTKCPRLVTSRDELQTVDKVVTLEAGVKESCNRVRAFHLGSEDGDPASTKS